MAIQPGVSIYRIWTVSWLDEHGVKKQPISVLIDLDMRLLCQSPTPMTALSRQGYTQFCRSCPGPSL